MLKSNELREGNFVYDVFDVKKGAVISRIDLEDLAMFINYSNHPLPFRPIELTEKMLLRIRGIKQLNEWQYKLNDWFVIERYTTKEKWSIRKVISEDSSILLCFIDFLHELQNITFSLTNKELEINL